MSCSNREICFRRVRDWTKAVPNIGIYDSTRGALLDVLNNSRRRREISDTLRDMGIDEDGLKILIDAILRDTKKITQGCRYKLFEPYKILFLFSIVFVVVSDALEITVPDVAYYIPSYKEHVTHREVKLYYFDDAALADIIKIAQNIKITGCKLESTQIISEFKEDARRKASEKRVERGGKPLYIDTVRKVRHPIPFPTPSSLASSVTISPRSPARDSGSVSYQGQKFFTPSASRHDYSHDTHRLRRFRKVPKIKVGDVVLVRRKGRTISAVISGTKKNKGIPVCFSNQNCWFVTKDCIVGKPKRKYKWTKPVCVFLKSKGMLGKNV